MPPKIRDNARAILVPFSSYTTDDPATVLVFRDVQIHTDAFNSTNVTDLWVWGE